MKNKIFVVAPLFMSIVLASTASYGFGGFGSIEDLTKKIPGLKPKSEETAKVQEEVESEELSVDQKEKVVQHYMLAMIRLSRAQIQMAEALGAKEEVLKLKVETDALSGSAFTKENVERQVTISKTTNKILLEKMSEQEELDNEKKKQFGNGMLEYAFSLHETVQTYEEVENLVSRAKKDIIGTFSGGTSKLGTLYFIAKKTPSLLKEHKDTVVTIKEYASTHDIETPEEFDDISWL